MPCNISKCTEHVQFGTVFAKNANSIHILVTADTSTSYASMTGIIEYQHGWSKCLTICYVSAGRSFERQTVRVSMNFIQGRPAICFFIGFKSQFCRPVQVGSSCSTSTLETCSVKLSFVGGNFLVALFSLLSHT